MLFKGSDPVIRIRFLLLLSLFWNFLIMSSSSNYGFPSGQCVIAAHPRQHTTRPIVTGTSVLGIVYDGGVLLAADTLLSYGGMAKFQGISRLKIIPGTNVILGATGEYSDFQKIVQILEQKALEETQTSATLMDSLYADHTNSMTAAATWNYLRFLMYQKRNKFNPYWNDLIVAGSDADGRKPFLGSVDKIGTTVTDHVLATGFGSYLALPLLREKWRPDLTEGEARAILEDCLKVLFYRDCRGSAQIQLAKIPTGGTAIVSDPYPIDTYWDDPAFVNAAPAALDGDGGW
jgi:20S proteasome subunit beta 7